MGLAGRLVYNDAGSTLPDHLVVAVSGRALVTSVAIPPKGVSDALDNMRIFLLSIKRACLADVVSSPGSLGVAFAGVLGLAANA